MKYFLNIECLVRKEKTKIIRSLLLDKIRLTSVGKNYLDEIIRNEKTNINISITLLVKTNN